jgi:hypothetical protein
VFIALLLPPLPGSEALAPLDTLPVWPGTSAAAAAGVAIAGHPVFIALLLPPPGSETLAPLAVASLPVLLAKRQQQPSPPPPLPLLLLLLLLVPPKLMCMQCRALLRPVQVPSSAARSRNLLQLQQRTETAAQDRTGSRTRQQQRMSVMHGAAAQGSSLNCVHGNKHAQEAVERFQGQCKTIVWHESHKASIKRKELS